MRGPIEVSLLDLFGVASLILINAGISLALKLGLGRKLLMASVRTFLQLTLLGYLLLPIFEYGHPWLVALLALAMTAIAAREATQRSSRRFKGVWAGNFVAIFVSAALTAILGAAVFIGVEPWWAPQYFIPLLGMILGNSLTGVTLGLDSTLTQLDDQRTHIEWRLAMGATWWEAARPVVRRATSAGMIPILNTMSVVGLVSIPGMMTGQLLGGTSPEQAARYQILILFLIAVATALGCVLAVLWATRRMFDDAHRLRLERLFRKK